MRCGSEEGKMRRNKELSYTDDSKAKISTLIGKDVVFDGNISAPESIRIDGTVNGNCECKAQLVIGESGLIKGDINAQNVLISGRVEGNISAYGKIEILSSGVLAGNIEAKALVIDEGACFDGRCTMTNGDKGIGNGNLYGESTYDED